MNILIVKATILFSLLLGAVIGLLSLFPPVIGFSIFALMFLCAPIVILFMKRDNKYLGIIDNRQGAILGAIIGFFSTVGFFVSFAPMVCMVHFIFKKYYAYAIPDMLQTSLWLFFVMVTIVALIFAATNSTSGMGCSFIINFFEKKPENFDSQLEIKIDD